MFQSPTLDRVVGGRICAGCGLCAAVSGGAVAMGLSADGYSRPEQRAPVAPEAERAIAAACPGNVVAAWDGYAEVVHPVWGPIRGSYTGNATDDSVWHGASSGGVLSALAIHALRTGRVDRVLHVAMDEGRPTLARRQLSRDGGAVMAGAGSRYGPVAPLAAIDAELAAGGRAMFIGKPCDVGALRRLATVDPRVDAVFAYMLGFFCAGTPSHQRTRAVVEALGFTEDDVAYFRYRGDGWPGFATVRARDGRTNRMSYAASWGDILSKQVQFRCKICPDAVGGVADVACADAWHGDEQGYPLFEEGDGRSLVLTRTAAGEELLRSAVEAGEVAVQPQDVGAIAAMQPSQWRRKTMLTARVGALYAWLKPRPRMAGLRIPQARALAPAAKQVREFLGTLRRVARGGY